MATEKPRNLGGRPSHGPGSAEIRATFTREQLAAIDRLRAEIKPPLRVTRAAALRWLAQREVFKMPRYCRPAIIDGNKVTLWSDSPEGPWRIIDSIRPAFEISLEQLKKQDGPPPASGIG